MSTVARITPLAETAADAAPITVLFAAAGFTVFAFCLIAAAPYADRWIAAREARFAAAVRRHLKRIGHGLGADSRRIDDWADEIAPRPEKRPT